MDKPQIVCLYTAENSGGAFNKSAHSQIVADRIAELTVYITYLKHMTALAEERLRRLNQDNID
ncbi:MAG: hypothetical protein KAI17_22325 [Thiotrichaceae bacterium]|nr:hypothetical protein [Thiotrichaceae bacterium]